MPLPARKTSGWSQRVLAGRDLCDDEPRPATLVDFRWSNLSDASSILAISTNLIVQQLNCWTTHLTLDNYIRRGYSCHMADAHSNPPLTPAVFHILLALSTGER